MTSKLLKTINLPFITLKVKTPSRVGESRLIAFYSVLYKIVSKLVANRLRGF